jgi:transcriptional regulator with XRE-family HTH domain
VTTADRSRHEVPIWVTVEWEVFRNRMKQRRVRLGLTQTELSERMGRSQDFVAVLENNTSMPNFGTLVQWLAALGGTLGPAFPD